jgi:hypothetical protein
MTVFQLMQAQREMAMAGGGFGAGVTSPDEGANARPGPSNLRLAAGLRIGRILDAKQQAAFTKLLGEPFDVSKIDPSLPGLSSDAGASPADDQADAAEKAEPAEKSAPSAKSRARRKRGTPPSKGSGAPAKSKDAGDKPGAGAGAGAN